MGEGGYIETKNYILHISKNWVIVEQFYLHKELKS